MMVKIINKTFKQVTPDSVFIALDGMMTDYKFLKQACGIKTHYIPEIQKFLWECNHQFQN